jgi:hypothetical protein
LRGLRVTTKIVENNNNNNNKAFLTINRTSKSVIIKKEKHVR